MEKIYRASITRRNEEEYRGTYDIYVAYFKAQSNGWKRMADFIRNDERLPGIHIISYENIDGEFIRYEYESDIILEDLLPSIEQGKVRFVNNYGNEYHFYVEPIKIED